MREHVDKDGKTPLPPYIYWNKKARKYEVRAYLDGEERKVGWFTRLDLAKRKQQEFIDKYEVKHGATKA